MTETLGTRYSYQEKGIMVPSKEALEVLLNGKGERVATELFASGGARIDFVLQLKGRSDGRRWFLLTAVAGDRALGFSDVWFLPDSPLGPIGKGGYPYTRRTADFDFPYSQIRSEAGDDGLYVQEKERRRAIGRTLLFTALELLRMAGAKRFYANQPLEEMETFYKTLGGRRVINGYEFLL